MASTPTPNAPGTPPETRPKSDARRRAARLGAVQALYQIAIGGATSEVVRGEFLEQWLDEEIEGLSESKQAELVALTWIGRGDFTVDEWSEVVRTARQRRTNPTADYLLGTPMLGDYLEEGLSQLGLTVEDMEPAGSN